MPPMEPAPWSALPERSRSRSFGAGIGAERGDDRHARAQLPLQRMTRVERYLDRDTLHDLGEIAGGVVGRQQRELRAASRGNAVDAPCDHDPWKGVDRDFRALADFDMGQLGFLVI